MEVSSPSWREVLSFQCVSQRFAGLPIAWTEAPDVGVEQVVGEVGPGPLASDLRGQERGVARFESVGLAQVMANARAMSAGEEAQALRVHRALRSSRTCGGGNQSILSPVRREVKRLVGAGYPGHRLQVSGR